MIKFGQKSLLVAAQSVNPVRPGLFSHSPGLGGLRGSDAKNQGWHPPIEMKLCMSHYSHKTIPDAKFEAGGSSSFGDMTSQNFPLKKKRVIRLGYLPPENEFNFKRNELLCPESFFSTQNWPPMSISAIFKQRNIFHFQNFWDVSMTKDQRQLP